MINSKKSIEKNIFHSHILIIIICIVLTSIIFNIVLAVFIRNNTKKQLISSAEIVQKSMNTEFFKVASAENESKYNQEMIKSILKINRELKKVQIFLDINYAVIGKNENIIYPRKDNSAEYNLLQQSIVPGLKNINKQKLNNAALLKKNVIYINASGERYSALLYPLKSEDGKIYGHLLLYSNLTKTKSISLAVNLVLLSILTITAFIASLISNRISAKISKPIIKLSNYAKQIGEREYNIEKLNYDDNEIGDLANSMYDMSEKLYAYHRTMKAFLENASHELRTPLMSIQGYSEAIKYGVAEDEKKAADIIIEESKRLTSIVEDLLYLSKIDSYQDKLELEQLKVEDLLKSCIERVNGITVSQHKNINIHFNQQNITVKGDEEKLSRAIINILGNCLRYAQKNIDVYLENNEGKAIITITDDGKGFEKEDLENMFTRFYKGKGGNHGLGLAITKSIVEKHKGEVMAYNGEKSGANFKITIPI
ncbi:MAG: ATPase, histidine kinase, gyrase and HSP90-like domain protein [Clostridiaceae bacterium]|jgi:signal transduction histidine kinase|nr:ATPase, histidine kinase, gyrase and HSP90-like domain protein [Clostridiaceae bacterium]